MCAVCVCVCVCVCTLCFHLHCIHNRADYCRYAKRIDAEMAKLDELEGDEANKPIIAELRRLINLNDSLKQQEAGFKASCQVGCTACLVA